MTLALEAPKPRARRDYLLKHLWRGEYSTAFSVLIDPEVKTGVEEDADEDKHTEEDFMPTGDTRGAIYSLSLSLSLSTSGGTGVSIRIGLFFYYAISGGKVKRDRCKASNICNGVIVERILRVSLRRPL
ncbi:MAG: hypothetical protein HY050_00280 [Actinobacteria bacterium]|nr:hypothetical protein [Actinomycetota bacterium]